MNLASHQLVRPSRLFDRVSPWQAAWLLDPPLRCRADSASFVNCDSSRAPDDGTADNYSRVLRLGGQIIPLHGWAMLSHFQNLSPGNTIVIIVRVRSVDVLETRGSATTSPGGVSVRV